MVERTHNQYKLDKETKEDLRKGIKRIEKLMEERDLIGDDIKEEFKQFKAQGYDTSALRSIISDRRKKRKNAEKFEEFENNKDLYKFALGM